jgi:hypothetical protein
VLHDRFLMLWEHDQTYACLILLLLRLLRQNTGNQPHACADDIVSIPSRSLDVSICLWRFRPHVICVKNKHSRALVWAVSTTEGAGSSTSTPLKPGRRGRGGGGGEIWSLWSHAPIPHPPTSGLVNMLRSSFSLFVFIYFPFFSFRSLYVSSHVYFSLIVLTNIFLHSF